MVTASPRRMVPPRCTSAYTPTWTSLWRGVVPGSGGGGGRDSGEAGVVGGEGYPVGECRPNRWQGLPLLGWRGGGGPTIEHRGPLLRILGAHDLPGLGVDQGQRTVTEQPPIGQLGRVEFLTHHRLHGVPPQRNDCSVCHVASRCGSQTAYHPPPARRGQGFSPD